MRKWLAGLERAPLTSSALSRAERARIGRRLRIRVFLGSVYVNLLGAVEGFVLLRVLAGGGHGIWTSTREPGPIPAIVGTAVGLVAATALYFVKPDRDIRQWVAADVPDSAIRFNILSLPVRGFLLTAAAWVVGAIVFLLSAWGLAWRETLLAIAIFAVAAVTNGALSFLLWERLARPLTISVLRDAVAINARVRLAQRIIAIWVIGSVIPTVGILVINIGRGVGWWPPSSTAVDVATVIVAAVSLIVGVRATYFMVSSVMTALSSIRRALDRIAVGDYDARVVVGDASELGMVQLRVNQMAMGLAEREQIRDLFSKHVGDAVASQALARGPDFHGTTLDAAVLFVDIAGSTTIAEDADPTAVAMMLNKFFAIVVAAVEQFGGFVNKFEGDAALAIFGTPTELPDPAGAALATAETIRDELSAWGKVKAGIGVSAGTVFAGNIGAESRYEFTVIGDPVNEAARLSELAKAMRAKVVASGAAMSMARVDPQWRSLGSVELRGKHEATALYTPDDEAPIRLSDTVFGLVGDVVRVLTPRPGRRS